MDPVHIKTRSYKYLILACDNLSGWVEAEALVKLNFRSVIGSFTANWVKQYGLCYWVMLDVGLEFQEELIYGIEICEIERESTR